MPLTPEQREKIIAAIQQRIPGRLGACPLCKSEVWTLADGVAVLSLQDRLGGLTIGGPQLPCVALICNTCGNTQLLNALLLGLAEVFNVTSPTQEEK